MRAFKIVALFLITMSLSSGFQLICDCNDVVNWNLGSSSELSLQVLGGSGN